MKKKVMCMVMLFAMISTFMLSSVQPKEYLAWGDGEIEAHDVNEQIVI